MNTLEACSIESPFGNVDECAKFMIDDTATYFLLTNIASVGNRYTLSFWVKADSIGSLNVADTSTEATTEWRKNVITFVAANKSIAIIFQDTGTYYIYHPQLETGNVATDWTPAPEDTDTSIKDIQTEANNATNATNERITKAESIIQQLSDCISMLVTDGNGESLMTQTADGWTFCMQETNESVSNIRSSLEELQLETDDTMVTVKELNQVVNDHGATLEYVNITTFEDEPCIELGESDSDFKLLITNTRIMFINGSNIPTFINTNGLVTQDIEVKGEIVQGGYTMLNTSDGGWGLLWKGVSS